MIAVVDVMENLDFTTDSLDDETSLEELSAKVSRYRFRGGALFLSVIICSCRDSAVSKNCRVFVPSWVLHRDVANTCWAVLPWERLSLGSLCPWNHDSATSLSPKSCYNTKVCSHKNLTTLLFSSCGKLRAASSLCLSWALGLFLRRKLTFPKCSGNGPPLYISRASEYMISGAHSQFQLPKVRFVRAREHFCLSQ